MADFTDRIKLIVDVASEGAKQGLSSIKNDVGQAEGAFGKLKAGAAGALDTIGSMGPAAVAGIGAGIATAAFQLAQGFEDAALSAQKFATQSGLAVQDASRWQEVAGDLGVNTETLAGALQKMNLADAKGTLAQLGIVGGNTNDKLLASLNYLNGIDDAARRAQEGAAIFGKSWGQLAPLVANAGALKQSLAEVSDQKVIDPEEVRKAEHFRDAIDGLVDKFDDLKLAVGSELIEPIADLASGLGNVADAAGAVTDVIPGLDGGLLGIATGPLRNVTDGFNTLTDSSSSLIDRARGLGQAVTGAIPGPLGAWAGGLFDVSDASDDSADAAHRQAAAAQLEAQAAKDAADAIAGQEKALRDLETATLASFNAQLGLADASDKTTKATNDYTTAFDAATAAGWGNKDANDAAATAQRDAEKAALAQAAAAEKLAEDQAKANGTTLSAADAANIQADSLRAVAGTLAADSPLRRSLLAYADQLEALPENATTTIDADTQSAAQKVKALSDQIYALVGQIFHVKIGATSTAAPSSSAAAAGATSRGLTAVPSAAVSPFLVPATTTVHVYAGAIVGNKAELGRVVADALDAHERRVGSRRRLTGVA